MKRSGLTLGRFPFLLVDGAKVQTFYTFKVFFKKGIDIIVFALIIKSARRYKTMINTQTQKELIKEILDAKLTAEELKKVIAKAYEIKKARLSPKIAPTSHER